jgi:hypothetical protein
MSKKGLERGETQKPRHVAGVKQAVRQTFPPLAREKSA